MAISRWYQAIVDARQAIVLPARMGEQRLAVFLHVVGDARASSREL